MEKFSIKESKILWLRKRRIPKRDKQAIKADLEGMSDIIHKAMNYTKKAPEKRETEIRFLLNTKEDSRSYYLNINYEPGMEGWVAAIYQVEHTAGFPQNHVGDVVSERWSIFQTFEDEYYEAPKTI